MKKHYLFISTIIAVAITFFVISVNNVKATSESKSIRVTEEITYILKDYNGRIALFEGNNLTPVKVYDIFTRSLPENDVIIIKRGISGKRSEVEKMLEEYLS